MATYYKYEKKQRVIAVTLLANAALLGLMYTALTVYLPASQQTQAANELLNVASIAIWPVEAIIIILAAYFWVKNDAFKLEVSPSTLFYHDPTFSSVTYRIPVNEIVAIEQFTNTQQTGLTNLLILKNGSTVELMYGNFRIDRKAFFTALKKANSKVSLPSSPYRYQVRQPSWAKRLLNRNKP